MQRIRLSAARGGDQIWQSDVSLKSVSDGTERERRILRGGGGSVKRERCWVNWRSWKEEGMRRNEGRDRWNTGKTFPKMVRAPVRASLSKYERRERRKKKEALGAEAPPYFPLSPRSCWTNTHLFLLIGAGLAETTGTYWLLLTFQNTVSAASGSAAAAAAACAHTFFTRQKKNHSCIFPNKYILKAFQKCCGCDPAVLTGGVVFRKKKIKRELHREITQRAAI